MHVQSPVGTFPVRMTRVQLGRGGPRVDAAMGAWRSEISFDRSDGPLMAAILVVLCAVFALGRSSVRRP